MFLQIDRDQHTVLVRLVEGRIRQLKIEILRCCEDETERQLGHDLKCLQRLLHELHEAECDVTA